MFFFAKNFNKSLPWMFRKMFVFTVCPESKSLWKDIKGSWRISSVRSANYWIPNAPRQLIHFWQIKYFSWVVSQSYYSQISKCHHRTTEVIHKNITDQLKINPVSKFHHSYKEWINNIVCNYVWNKPLLLIGPISLFTGPVLKNEML